MIRERPQGEALRRCHLHRGTHSETKRDDPSSLHRLSISTTRDSHVNGPFVSGPNCWAGCGGFVLLLAQASHRCFISFSIQNGAPKYLLKQSVSDVCEMSHRASPPIAVEIPSDDDCSPLPPPRRKKRLDNGPPPAVLVIADDPTPQKPSHPSSIRTPSFVAETPVLSDSALESSVSIVKCSLPRAQKLSGELLDPFPLFLLLPLLGFRLCWKP